MMKNWFMLQKKQLQSLYDDKVKDLVKKLLILDGDSKGCVEVGYHILFLQQIHTCSVFFVLLEKPKHFLVLIT